MNIYTLNVGQGQFVVVTSGTEAIIIDTYVSLDPRVPIVNVKAALSTILSSRDLVGLVITGFDADHFNEVGLKIVLNKYRPHWLMYPKYYKRTATADACFAAIRSFENQKGIIKHPIALNRNDTRFYNRLSTTFSFEVFSPHAEDMNSSNNCSLVCKVTEVASRATYLVTGDTETDRWASIAAIFRGSIASLVLAAPHHGSKNGLSGEALRLIRPHTILISAGVNNAYGHPDQEAVELYGSVAQQIYATNARSGQSLMTSATAHGVSTTLFTP